MSEKKTGVQRSWLNRLGDLLSKEPQDQQELLEILRDAQQRDLVNPDILAMLEGVLQVSVLRVSDIMVARSQMVMVSHDSTLTDLLPIIMQSGHSRFPVFGKNEDEVRGVLLAKDLLPYAFKQGEESFDLSTIMRTITVVPEGKRLEALLQEFRADHAHMAIVVDEYGAVSGLVTIEDVLEEIVGDIEDEHDEEEIPIIKNTDEEFIFDAKTTLEAFNDYFHSDLHHEEFNTIGGFLLNLFGHVPQVGETIVVSPYEFHILKSDNRRIYSVGLRVIT